MGNNASGPGGGGADPGPRESRKTRLLSQVPETVAAEAATTIAVPTSSESARPRSRDAPRASTAASGASGDPTHIPTRARGKSIARQDPMSVAAAGARPRSKSIFDNFRSAKKGEEIEEVIDGAWDDDGSIPDPAMDLDGLQGEEDGGRKNIEEMRDEELEQIANEAHNEKWQLQHKELHDATFGSGFAALAQEENAAWGEFLEAFKRQHTLVMFPHNVAELVRSMMVARRQVTTEEERLWVLIAAAVASDREETLRLMMASKAARVIQKNYRRSAAKRYVERLRHNKKHIVMVQRFARVHVSLFGIEMRQRQLYEKLEAQRLEFEARRAVLNEEKQAAALLAQARNADYEAARAAEAARVLRERQAAEREKLTAEEEEGRGKIVAEEDPEWNTIWEAHLSEHAALDALLKQRALDEHQAKVAEYFKEQHSGEKQELLEDEVGRRKGINREEEDGWSLIAIKAPASRTKAQHTTMSRILHAQRDEREMAVNEETAARGEWTGEEDQEWGSLWKFRMKDFAKAKERHALREEIERLRVEQEYQYVRNLFIILKEEEEWETLEELGLRERGEISGERVAGLPAAANAGAESTRGTRAAPTRGDCAGGNKTTTKIVSILWNTFFASSLPRQVGDC